MAGLVNQLAITPEPGVGAEQISRRLFGTPGIASVEAATATTEFVRDRLDDFIGVLQLTVIFALALALLIAFNSASISADERARENATMLAFGIPVRQAVGLAVGESLIIGALGTLIGLAGGLLVIGWVVNHTLPDTLPDLGLVISISSARSWSRRSSAVSPWRSRRCSPRAGCAAWTCRRRCGWSSKRAFARTTASWFGFRSAGNPFFRLQPTTEGGRR